MAASSITPPTRLNFERNITLPVDLHQGDCLEVLATIPADSIHAIVTDPPYGLSDHSPQDVVDCLTAWLAGKEYRTNKKGFMNRTWDAWVPGPEVWRECYRVLKPGGNMLVFAGTRTHDLMGIALRLAGFELRDTLSWNFGSGLPKGLNISKALTKTLGATDEADKWRNWNTALKPNYENILLVRKPLDGTVIRNVMKHGVGGYNIDACRVPVDEAIDDPRLGGKGTWSTDMMAKNAYGEYAGTETGSSPLGRYPSNVITDGSESVLACFPDAPGAQSAVIGNEPSLPTGQNGIFNVMGRVASQCVRNDRDTSAARFFMKCEFTDEESRIFYASKVSPKEREGSKHPTIKPLSLMRYLCRLITPEGGTVIDPFAGSGTTGLAAVEEGFNAILIEQEVEYVEHIKKRLALFLN